QGAGRARAQDPAAPLLRGTDAVADRAAGRDLADARLTPDPPLAREDPRRDRCGRAGGRAQPPLSRSAQDMAAKPKSSSRLASVYVSGESSTTAISETFPRFADATRQG